MIAVVLSGFVVALLPLVIGRYLRGRWSVLFAILPTIVFAYFLSFVPEVSAGRDFSYNYPWVPSLGVNLRFTVDGLSLLFSLLISGTGILIFIYASAYLKEHPYLDRFFGYLCVFMASMLGLVLSDNIILLFIFWELTSLSSFFLIGFDNADREARKSALLALMITSGGGFLLLAGLVLLAGMFDSYSLDVIRQSAVDPETRALYPLLVFLLLAGVFTKSAQFPFHFWLPRAMSAPTPVSAYLHSATMVKAGIYLLMRFTPVLGEGSLWNTSLLVVGAITMLYAALHSIFRTDLKTILAYSTVAALGMLVFLIGIATKEAYVACVVFILVHACYKAALFLVAGTLEHTTGTRDVTRLGGLARILAPLAIAGVLAALSGAGFPFTFGFLGKDLIYAATLHSGSAALLTTLVVLTNILLLYAAFVAGVKPFVGRLPETIKGTLSSGSSLWWPPLLLSATGIAVGIFPQILEQSLIIPAVFAMREVPSEVALRLWHGFNLILLLSGITLAAGIALFVFFKPSHEKEQALFSLHVLSPLYWLSQASGVFGKFSLRYTRVLQNGYLRSYLITVIVFLICIVSYKLFTEVRIYLSHKQSSDISVYEWLVFLIMAGAIFKTVSTRSRITAIVSMSAVGYCMCLFFVLFSAPDLAMTQFAIDTLTIVLFVLVLLRLPPYIRFSNAALKLRDGLISLCFGFLISMIALQVLNEPTDKTISRFYADNAYLEAKGKNVVNVILVDFRGFDTLVEITVLTIAAIGVYSLLKLKVSTPEKE